MFFPKQKTYKKEEGGGNRDIIWVGDTEANRSVLGSKLYDILHM